MFVYFCFSMLKWVYELLGSFSEYSRLSWDYTLYDCGFFYFVSTQILWIVNLLVCIHGVIESVWYYGSYTSQA